MNYSFLGIDLGGTNIRVARLQNEVLGTIYSAKVPKTDKVEVVLEELYALIEKSIDSTVTGIGIGVPSVVDTKEGVVYDVQNIPSWKKVPLKKILEKRYQIPVVINNDANCFALGEKYYGKGQNSHSFIGLSLGTGLGAGIIVNNELYAGNNYGAGEFGMVSYLDKYYEYYTSGQFFKYCYNTTGEEVYKQAQLGDEFSLKIFSDYGYHLANVIKMILYTYDPKMIILGGSVSKSFSFFQQKMWECLASFTYSNSLKNFSIEVSNLENSGILGAIALCHSFKSYKKRLCVK